MNNEKHETYCGQDLITLLLKVGFDWRDYFVAHSIDEHFHWEIPLHIAQKWLREVKHLDVIINRNHPIHEPQYSWEYEYVIIATDGRVKAVDCYFEEYEQAQEAGIKKALEIILEEEE